MDILKNVKTSTSRDLESNHHLGSCNKNAPSE